MALGAMSEQNSKTVQIVPVGLNYFKREKFRSEVIIEFGRPFEIPSEWGSEFKSNKKETTEKLLKEIESRLKAVTLRAPTYEELRALHLLRKIYLPKKTKLTPTQYSEVCKRFTKGYEKLKEQPECRDTVKRIHNYITEIDEIAITDTEVSNIEFKQAMLRGKFYYSTFVFFMYLLFILPGYIIMIPFIIYIKRKAEKERLAVRIIYIIYIF
jgi:glycerol-3-phosphate O-acyltransferase/dihydroxyacetone phosphate acyltransferase